MQHHEVARVYVGAYIKCARVYDVLVLPCVECPSCLQQYSIDEARFCAQCGTSVQPAVYVKEQVVPSLEFTKLRMIERDDTHTYYIPRDAETMFIFSNGGCITSPTTAYEVSDIERVAFMHRHARAITRLKAHCKNDVRVCVGAVFVSSHLSD